MAGPFPPHSQTTMTAMSGACRRRPITAFPDGPVNAGNQGDGRSPTNLPLNSHSADNRRSSTQQVRGASCGA